MSRLKKTVLWMVLIVVLILLSPSIVLSDFEVWSFQEFDSGCDFWNCKYGDIAVDSFGRPHLVYHYGRFEIRYANWTGSQWDIRTIATSTSTLAYVQMALDSDDIPHVVYVEGSPNMAGIYLKYAKWDGSSWATETVPSISSPTTEYLTYPDIAVDDQGGPHISYARSPWDDSGSGKSTLRYAYKDPSGSTWLRQEVDTGTAISSFTGEDLTLVLDSTNIPVILYSDDQVDVSGTGDSLCMAKKNGAGWDITRSVDYAGMDLMSSIALDSSDYPHIVFARDATTTSATLFYRRWTGTAWTSRYTVDGATSSIGVYNSLKLDSNNYPHVSYYSKTSQSLKYAEWNGSDWRVETVDSGANTGTYTSLALDSQGKPFISYFDETNAQRKLAYPINCVDSDLDGYSISGGYCGDLDCDDSNPSVYPGNTDNPYCNCDDADGTVQEAAEISCSDNQDNDCDGLVDGDDSDCASAGSGCVVQQTQEVILDGTALSSYWTGSEYAMFSLNSTYNVPPLIDFTRLSPAGDITYSWDPYDPAIQITSDGIDRQNIAIYGDIVVWDDSRDGNRNIYLCYLSEDSPYTCSDASEQDFQVTSDPSIQNNPEIYGDAIVWEDFRDGNWRIYMYNLSTGQETTIPPGASTLVGDANNPDIYKDIIVWEHYIPEGFRLYYYDLSSGVFGDVDYAGGSNPSRPSVYEGTIVWFVSEWTTVLFIYSVNISDSTSYEDFIYYEDPRPLEADVGPHHFYPVIHEKGIVFSDSWYHLRDNRYGDWRELPDASVVESFEMHGENIVWRLNYDYTPSYGPVGSIYYYNLSERKRYQISEYGDDPDVYEEKVVWLNEGNIYLYNLTNKTPPITSFNSLWNPDRSEYLVLFNHYIPPNPSPPPFYYGDIGSMVVSADGTMLYENSAVAETYAYGKYYSAWNNINSEYGIIYNRDYDVNFARLDATGAKITGSEKQLLTGNYYTSDLIWNPEKESYAFSYVSVAANRYLYFKILDSQGNDLNTQLISSGDIYTMKVQSSVAWTGSMYGLVWSGGSVLIDENGQIIADTLTTFPQQIYDAKISWVGSYFSITYKDYDGNIYLRRIDIDGNQVGTDLLLGQSDDLEGLGPDPSISIDGSDVFIFHYAYPNTNIVNIYKAFCCDDADSDSVTTCDTVPDCDDFNALIFPGNTANPYCNCDDTDGTVQEAAEISCSDGADNDCDGLVDREDPDCPCTFTNAYWSAETASAGSKVTMTVEGTNCEDGETVNFNIWEDDLIFNEDINDQFFVNPTSVFNGGKATASWYTIYIPDGPGGLFDPPEFYFNAELASDTSVSMRSQGPGANGLLSVQPNQMPTQPTPFLIEPNGGETYDASANVTWNPAVDPENDTITYSLYYSADSGTTWNPLAYNIGFINQMGGENSFTIGFGGAAATAPYCGDESCDSGAGEDCSSCPADCGACIPTNCGDGTCDDGNYWTEATSSAGWTARAHFSSLVFNNEIWVMGGSDGTNRLNDIWHSSDGVTWNEVVPSGDMWDARTAFSSVVFNGEIWVMGGYAQEGLNYYRNDVWHSSDGITWTQATASAPWVPRSNFASVAFDGKIWVMGGLRGSDGYRLNDVWYSEDGVNWYEAVPYQSIPPSTLWSGRDYHGSVVFNNEIWVIGGFDTYGGYSSLNDVWHSSDGITWTQATASAPWTSRRSPVPVVFNNEIWVMGGYHFIDPFTGTYLNDVWHSSDGITWTQATLSADWQPRFLHRAVVFNDKIWVMGGSAGTDISIDTWYNDVWYYPSLGEEDCSNCPADCGACEVPGIVEGEGTEYGFPNLADYSCYSGCTYTPLCKGLDPLKLVGYEIHISSGTYFYNNGTMFNWVTQTTTPYSIATGRSYTDIVEIAGRGSYWYAYYLDGTYSRGTTADAMTESMGSYTIKSGETYSDIVGIAGSVEDPYYYAFYDDGAYSYGDSPSNLANLGEGSYTIDATKTYDDILAISLTSSDYSVVMYKGVCD